MIKKGCGKEILFLLKIVQVIAKSFHIAEIALDAQLK